MFRYLAFLGLGTASVSGSALRIFPEKASLAEPGRQQSFVAQLVETDGRTQDVTSKVRWTVTGPGKWDGKSAKLRGEKAGEIALTAELNGQTLAIPIEVKATGTAGVSFRREVMPIFMRAGCNSGSCHGAGRGQDGFRLSLFGYDPAGDHFRLCEEYLGRRIDLAQPEKSLLLEKSIGAVAHTGGELFKKDSAFYKTIQRWIQDGAADDSTAAAPTGLRLLPEKMVMRRGASEQQAPTQRTVVMAQYADGSEEDVTHLALFLSNNDAVATIDKHGLVKTRASGAAFLFARFSKFTVGSEAIVLPASEKFDWPAEATAVNYVDEAVFDRLKKLQIRPSPLADDATFLRRVSLDLTGLPPSAERAESFIADSAPDKRAKLIDELLASPEFTDLWTMKWSEILQIRTNNNDADAGRSRKAVWKYAQWLRQQIATNRPFDATVRELLTADGSNIAGPQANFYTTAIGNTRKPMERAEDVAQLFLGTRIQCAQCHNHPFDRWTMDDYYGFTAFFAGLGTKSGSSAAEVFVLNNNEKHTAEHPVDGRAMPPRFLGGNEPTLEGKDPRSFLADWMTSTDNPVFPRTLANRIWAHLFGRGIIEPVDDARISNPPSNEALLASLAQRLVAGKYDIRQAFRDICNSRTYQLSSTTNESNAADNTCFSHSYVRRLQAEVIADLIAAVCEAPQNYSGMVAGTRAVQIYDGGAERENFLKNFGASKRETVCACEVRTEPTLTQMLAMMNGSAVDGALQRSKFLHRLLDKRSSTPAEDVSAIFRQALGRVPTEPEIQALLAGTDVEHWQTDLKQRRKFLEDVLWGTMNTTEFLFNH
jgi:hypothetical protein